MKSHVPELEPALLIERRGYALVPSNDELDGGGVLNPGCTRTREGKLLLFPRIVEEGNISRIGIYEPAGDGTFRRLQMALEPSAPYEFRDKGDGYGCEDPRVTFIPVLNYYVMSYSAFGADGPRIALATSPDALHWTRLGLVDFSETEFDGCHDKDAVFFPEPVLSPHGVESLAFYHRPTHGRDGILHEDIWLAYVPLEAVRADPKNLLIVETTTCVLEAGGAWGRIKVGGGTPPIRTPNGWLSLYHGVDRSDRVDFGGMALTYRAGVMLHDERSPHKVKYVSPKPILEPETDAELNGVVNRVVFPTAIDTAACETGFAMVYYGMADAAIGAAQLDFRDLENVIRPR